MLTYKLNKLYESYGYRKFKLSKFEQYELYAANKDFLNTAQIISFTDLDGELLALKPDVTLSIMKSGVGVGRVYYNENVYRPKAGHYRETSQSGIEYIGRLTTYAEAEVIALAAKSLKLFGEDIVIRISDVALLSGIFEKIGIDESMRFHILRLFENKNTAGIDALVKNGGIDEEAADKLKKLIDFYFPLGKAVDKLKEANYLGSILPQADGTVKHLYELKEGLDAFGVSELVYLDFSLINSMDYYNGLIFQGAVSGIPFTVLSGGRYDKLAVKMGKDMGAVGFAMDISLLENYMEVSEKYDADYIIIYDESGGKLARAIQTVENLVQEGYKVQLVEKSEKEDVIKRIRAKEVIDLF